MTAKTTIFCAKKIITINASQPTATHVAVRDGRILGVGSLEELQGWGPYDLDERFADKVLMPGLVEGHCHLAEGGMWRNAYVGYYDRRGPDGTLWKGLKSFDEVVERLREAQARLSDSTEPLLAWGFDPIYFKGPRMTARDLDRVSPTRPVIVLHASFHLMNVNSAMLRAADITADTPIEGIPKGPDGQPSGELQEFAAMYLVYRVIGDISSVGAAQDPVALRRFGEIARGVGVTTATDLVNDLSEATITNMREITADEDYPVRIVPAFAPMRVKSGETGAQRVLDTLPLSTDKLRFGLVKLVIDGSIQGFTARLRWPGYYNGSPNGLWLVPPQQVAQQVAEYHKAGLQVHIHTNGDEASEVALDAIEGVLRAAPRWDHRHTLQHCQMADTAQFQRMASLGVCVNLFSNHLYYWGDAHYTQTMGPERANRMDAAGTAKRLGVNFAIHSDAPITPLGPLFTAWCAVNRQTASGRVLGEAERISVEDALHAITLGAAYTLKMDHQIGSLEAGKFADFAVLEQDPLAVPASALKDIPVWGTVLGGRVFPAPGG
ncbi:amidohydrolase [Pandoraea terrae]|uniref:Amidohydrolase n=1 Tax=Pandoraea terrae TaxID=1537710 RepID=A0A5E4W195_9BURK|nr:amidohydrolase [Pandoraea terrae]VVE16915.1 amidohydrolase [Pandoraea terrae]